MWKKSLSAEQCVDEYLKAYGTIGETGIRLADFRTLIIRSVYKAIGDELNRGALNKEMVMTTVAGIAQRIIQRIEKNETTLGAEINKWKRNLGDQQSASSQLRIAG
jgi:hypothetical protein